MNDGFGGLLLDTFDEVKNYTAVSEVWEESRVVMLADTPRGIGLFNKSDIIIMYDEDNKPVLIAERIFRKDYTLRKWLWQRRLCKNTYKHGDTLAGWSFNISTGKDYIDFVQYKEEYYLECVNVRLIPRR